MNDEELDRLVAQSMYSNTDVRALDVRVGEADLMENVMNSTTPTIERPQPARPKPARRRRNLLAGLAVGGALATGAGVTYAVVADRLSPDQAELVDDLGATGEVTCGISSENARLVASTTSAGRTVEYWTVDDADSHGDLLFESGAAFGGGGCGPMSRAVAHPQLPKGPFASTSPHPRATSWSSPTYQSKHHRRRAPRRWWTSSCASTHTQQTAPCLAPAV